jgi:oligosaccharide repeat unit polymerase
MAYMVHSKSFVQLPQVRRHLLLHPVCLYLLIWLLVMMLYLLRLSQMLVFDSNLLFAALGSIVLPFLFVALMFQAWFLRNGQSIRKGNSQSEPHYMNVLTVWRRIGVLFIFWAGASLFEIVMSGGVPLLWLVTGDSKIYFDFGVPTLHGLLNSIILGVSLCSFVLYRAAKQKKFLVIPTICIGWSLVIISRQLLVSLLLEIAIVFIATRALRIKSIIMLAFYTLVGILVFGIVGDFRSGKEAFLEVAQPQNFPSWMPTGFLWLYTYITTPINNLLNTITLASPADTFYFKETLSQFCPTVLRNIVFRNETLLGGVVFSPAFNTCTAFAQPYLDMGYYGVALYSAYVATLTHFFWYRRKFSVLPIYAVLAQCMVFSTSINSFFYLPVISQCFWVFAIFWGTEHWIVVRPLAESVPFTPSAENGA